MSLIEFPVGRSAAPTHQVCECGSEWFELVRDSADRLGVAPAMVQVATDGTIVGWTGRLQCGDCGRRR